MQPAAGVNDLPHTTLVIPCHNEADRLDVAAFTGFLALHPHIELVFVDDGSTDRTLEVLRGMEAGGDGRVNVLALARNQGKAEAVRRGMNHALAAADLPKLVGFWDADLSTPLEALRDFVRLLHDRPALDIVMGARILMLGRAIDRRPLRHYAGRIFATAASIVLQLPVYDTQCGAKVFRVSPRLARVLDRPFLTRWVFDVELIARYGSAGGQYDPNTLVDVIYEMPLRQWYDVPGSKVRWIDFWRALIDLARIRLAYISRAPVRFRRVAPG